MNCRNCQKKIPLIKTQKYQYDLSGLENIFLDNIGVYSCIKCEIQMPVIPKVLKLHNTIAFAIVCKSSPLEGAEIRFLRKNLRIKSQDWAKLLRTDKSVYSRWENGSQSISAQSDLLIRYLYIRLLEERKEVRLEKKIVETLSEITDEKTVIVIDVEQIEKYSYMPMSKARSLAGIQNPKTERLAADLEETITGFVSVAYSGNVKFDFDLDETNSFPSEIERPLPFEKANNESLNSFIARTVIQGAANQELALGA